jgi:VCBS repeat-containing protein
VLGNDTDADSDPLTAALDASATHGTLTLNANGGFSYTPTAGYTGPDSFTYHANDGTANSNIVTVSLTVDAASSLRGWWKMDSNLTDSSGLANHASLVGSPTPTFVAGQVGQALSLDGSQNASVPDANSLDLTTGMTLVAWIRPGVTINTTQDVIKKATLGGVNGYELSLSSAGKVFVRLNQVTSADTFRVNSTTSYPLNNTAWLHVAATYDGTTIKLYVNGVQEGGNLAGPAAIATNTLAVGLGAQSDNTRRYTGLLDDARIYATALSASQIAALANVGAPAAPVATADSYSTPQDTALVQPAPGVLANDTDANSDPLTAVLNANVTHGTLSLSANGGFSYTPTAGYTGPDSFTYHANDGTADSNIVTVSLTVNGVAATQGLTALAASASTSDKPQSKLWQNAGAWWMVAPSTTQLPAGTWIWKLAANLSWSPMLRLSSATDTHADVRAIGDVTHILLYGAAPQLYSVQYNSSSSTYEPWGSLTTATSVTLPGS